MLLGEEPAGQKGSELTIDTRGREARRVGGRTCFWRSLACSLFAEGNRQDYLFGFAFFTADFLAPFFALLFPLPRSALAAW